MKVAGVKIKFETFNDYNFLMDVSGSDLGALQGLSMLQEELPRRSVFSRSRKLSQADHWGRREEYPADHEDVRHLRQIQQCGGVCCIGRLHRQRGQCRGEDAGKERDQPRKFETVCNGTRQSKGELRSVIGKLTVARTRTIPLRLSPSRGGITGHYSERRASLSMTSRQRQIRSCAFHIKTRPAT